MANKKDKDESSFLGDLLDKLKFEHPVKKAMKKGEGKGTKKQRKKAEIISKGFRGED